MRIGRFGEKFLRGAATRAGDDNLRKVLMLWLLEIGRRDPAAALRTMLVLQEDIEGLIDKAAIAYDGGVHAKHRLMRYHDFFVEHIGADDRVLDVGCGKGELAHDIATRSGATVVGVDFEPRYLETASTRFAHGRVEYRLADATTFESDEHFDVVVLSNVLEHIEDRARFLRRLAALGPDRFLVRVPMWSRHWTVPLRRELGLEALGPGHFIEYDESTLRAELAAAGLTVTELVSSWGELWARAESVR